MTADRIDDPIVVPSRLREGEPPAEPHRHRFPPFRWWAGLEPTERVLYRGLVLMAVGLAPLAWPLAALVPGAVLTAIAVFTIATIAWRGD